MNTSKPVVLVDLSSFIFYRFYAIQRWMGISKTELNPEQVLEKFSKLFEDNLKDIKKKLKVEWKNIVLAKDCLRDKIWRMAIYPEYKGTRDAKRSQTFDPTVFTTAYNDIIPRMQQEYGFYTAQYDNAEADDVIAVIHNEVRRAHSSTPIYVLSADTDFIQLSSGPSSATKILNFQLKPIGASFDEDKYKHYILWKTIRGDSCDNIPAIDKKIGDATAMKLAKDPVQLQARLEASPTTRANFARNNLLINFDQIPCDIVDGVVDLMKSFV